MNIKKLIVSNLVLSMVFACGVATVSLEASGRRETASEAPGATVGQDGGDKPVVLFQKEPDLVPAVATTKETKDNELRDQQFLGLVKAEKDFKETTQDALTQHATIGTAEYRFGTLKKVCVSLCLGSALVWGGLSVARFKGIHILCKRLSLFRIAGLATGLGAVLFNWLRSREADLRDKQVIITVTPAAIALSKVFKAFPREVPSITDEAGKTRLIEDTNMLCCMKRDYQEKNISYWTKVKPGQKQYGYEYPLNRLHNSIYTGIDSISHPLEVHISGLLSISSITKHNETFYDKQAAEKTRTKYLALAQSAN